MKKAGLVIIIYFAFLFVVITLIFQQILSLNDYVSILFLNTEHFPDLNLERINFQFIISFLLLSSLILYFLIQTITETVSFMSMVIYRQGKVKNAKSRTIYYSKKLFMYYILSIFTVLILYFTFSRFNSYNGILFDILSMIIYVFRYFLVIFCIIFLYEIGSMADIGGASYFVLILFFIIMISVDVIVGTNIITYSGDLFCEIVTLFTTIIIGTLICFGGFKAFDRKGDIL